MRPRGLWPILAIGALLGMPGCSEWTLPVDPGQVARPPEPPARPPDPILPGEPGIYIAGADGSGARRVAAGGWPDWAPGGATLLLVENGEIRRVNADGSGLVTLVSGTEPAWSPDGTRIAFTSAEGITVMNVDGSGLQTVVAHGFRGDTYRPWDMGVGKPAWSPDGVRIAFEHRGDGDMVPAQVFVVNLDGTAPRRLTPTVGAQFAESDPAFSPDGTTIAFWSYGFGLATVPASGGTPRTLYWSFPTVSYGARPDWSPDGRTILFTANRYGNAPAVWSLSLGDLSLRPLLTPATDAAWSPDGTRLAFVRPGLP